MKKIALILTALMALSLLSCGGPMPETPTETPVATPETAEPVESEPITPAEPVIPDPDATHRALIDMISAYRDVYIFERKTYLSESDVEKIDDDTNHTELLDALGDPHVEANNRFGVIGIYVLENAQILEVRISGTTTILRYDVDTFATHIAEKWVDYPVVPSDPSQTYAALYAEMEKRQYMQISERTDYADPLDARKINNRQVMLIDDMVQLLGEPHFLQIEETMPPYENVGRQLYYVYVLSDGTVFIMSGYVATPKVGYARVYQPDTAIEYLLDQMYF